jgi:hypothetical protein
MTARGDFTGWRGRIYTGNKGVTVKYLVVSISPAKCDVYVAGNKANQVVARITGQPFKPALDKLNERERSAFMQIPYIKEGDVDFSVLSLFELPRTLFFEPNKQIEASITPLSRNVVTGFVRRGLASAIEPVAFLLTDKLSLGAANPELFNASESTIAGLIDDYFDDVEAEDDKILADQLQKKEELAGAAAAKPTMSSNEEWWYIYEQVCAIL